tara:strand:+ start:1037 stop:1534 length:498 start_codon:yes stop_codon:yes gene_type:complete
MVNKDMMNKYESGDLQRKRDEKKKQEKKRLSNKLDYEKHKEKRKATVREYMNSRISPKQRKRKKMQDRERHIVKKYGITEEMYHDMSREQGDMCSICKKHKDDVILPDNPRSGQRTRPFVIDHCHKTNTVRGLLCNKCNTALGLFNDDVELLRFAKEYLIESRDV